MEEVKGITGGEQWGCGRGETGGPCRQTGGGGGAGRWGGGRLSDRAGWRVGGSRGGMGSGQPADAVQASRRHPQRGTSGMPDAALSWKQNTMGDERGGAN